MSGNVKTLPFWKKDATPSERFSELSSLALEQPELFESYFVVYRERLGSGQWKVRTMFSEGDTAKLIGLLELAKDQHIKDSYT